MNDRPEHWGYAYCTPKETRATTIDDDDCDPDDLDDADDDGGVDGRRPKTDGNRQSTTRDDGIRAKVDWVTTILKQM